MKQDLLDTTVVLDVDDTLYPYSYAITRAVRRLPDRSDFNRPYVPPAEYDLTKSWGSQGFTRELWNEVHLRVASEPDWHEHAPIEGSQEAVAQLQARGAHILLLTKRVAYTRGIAPQLGEAHAQQTKTVIDDWLGKHFGFPSEIVSQAETATEPKGSHLLTTDRDKIVFVEDNATEIVSLRGRGERVVAVRYPHNENVINQLDGLRSFADWNEGAREVAAEANDTRSLSSSAVAAG